jgi:hypothetical protein
VALAAQLDRRFLDRKVLLLGPGGEQGGDGTVVELRDRPAISADGESGSAAVTAMGATHERVQRLDPMRDAQLSEPLERPIGGRRRRHTLVVQQLDEIIGAQRSRCTAQRIDDQRLLGAEPILRFGTSRHAF